MPHFDQLGEYQLDQVLAKRLTTPGGTVAPTVAPELFPCLVLEQDRPEWGFLKGELSYGRAVLLTTPGAGAHAAYCLSNPANSRQLVVVKELYSSVLCRLAMSAPATTASTPLGLSRDSRNTRNGAALTIAGNSLTAGLPNRIAWIPANQTYREPFIVSPGNFLTMFSEVGNLGMDAHILWTERGAQPGELP